jgi:hypothetical protein
MTLFRKLIAFLHNLWATGPLPSPNAQKLWPIVQAAIIVVVLALWAFFQGYGWYIPADPTNVHLWLAEFSNAAVLAFAIVVPLVQQRIWPALVPYLLTLFSLIQTTEISPQGYSMSARAPLRPITLWMPA